MPLPDTKSLNTEVILPPFAAILSNEPLANVAPPLPVSVKAPPVVTLIAPVELAVPIVIWPDVMAVPILIEPVVMFIPRFRMPVAAGLRATVVPAVIFVLLAEEPTVIVFVVVMFVAPVPVRVAEPEPIVKRVVPLVSKARDWASLVPRVAVAPKLLPPFTNTLPVLTPLKVPVPLQAKLPLELVTVHPVEAEPPPRRISPVELLPISTAPLPLASRERLSFVPLGDMAVAPTINPLTWVELRLPPEMVAPLMVLVHAKAPVELVTVHPVEPDPPPMLMSPVEVPPMLTAPLPLPSKLMAVLVPPEATDAAPANVRAEPVKVLLLYVPVVVMFPLPKVSEPLLVLNPPPAVAMALPFVVSPPGTDTV